MLLRSRNRHQTTQITILADPNLLEVNLIYKLIKTKYSLAQAIKSKVGVVNSFLTKRI